MMVRPSLIHAPLSTYIVELRTVADDVAAACQICSGYDLPAKNYQHCSSEDHARTKCEQLILQIIM